MNSRDNGAPTSLYLLRVWERRSGDGVLHLHGKLQHTVSGASCYFDELSGLPIVLQMMMEQEANSFDLTNPNTPGPEDAAPFSEEQSERNDPVHDDR